MLVQSHRHGTRRIGRIKPSFLDEERRQHGDSFVRQEYGCSFEALEGLVYPDFARCVVPALPSPLGGEGSGVRGNPVGGLDFGVRNPFAAVWGVLDRDDILWLTGEHYCRNQTLDFHKQHMPREVMWYCDPAGARERIELSAAGRKVRPGINDLRLGIMAVRSRLETGRLRVVDGACPNLLYEAGLYRYDDATNGRGSETPLSESNHALDALRYLISRLDQRRMAKDRRPAAPADGAAAPPESPAPKEDWRKR